MGRMYAVSFADVAVDDVEDLFELLVPSNAVMVLHELTISQVSQAGDAGDEQLRLSIRRVTGSPTPGDDGTAPTPQPLEEGSPASGITAEVNNTTRLVGGTATVLRQEVFNVRAGYHYLPTPEMRPVFSPDTYCVIGLETEPNEEIALSGTIIVEEIGG